MNIARIKDKWVGKEVFVYWKDTEHEDWYWFRLIGINRAGRVVTLKGMDDPVEFNAHTGDRFTAHVSEIAVMCRYHGED